jgi:hypothetical protein
MSKKLFKLFFISFLLVAAACAPKPVVAPPSLYEETVLSLDEIIEKASGDTLALKAITEIEIRKNNEHYDSISASVLVKMPDWVHVRMYKFGMLVNDFVVMDDRLHVLSGKGGPNLKKFGKEFHNAIFWWDDIQEGVLYSNGPEYIIRARNKEIHIDKATLLPLKQRIVAFNRNIEIAYEEPVEEKDGYWHPSVINILAGDFSFTVKLKKLLRNPQLGEFDFRVPEEG